MSRLEATLAGQIDILCEQGNQLADAGDMEQARQKFEAALALIPPPHEQHEEAGWVFVSLGDTAFLSGRYQDGVDALTRAVHCPDVLGNPFVHLRLGQCQFELGNLDRAADELTRAYMGGGRDLFEDDDAKFLEFLSSRIHPPDGQTSL